MAPLKNVDPVVRSIRIAATLNDRFGALLKEAASYQKVAEFELKIGEAQQIYPEIWRHFDEARAPSGRRESWSNLTTPCARPSDRANSASTTSSTPRASIRSRSRSGNCSTSRPRQIGRAHV